MVAIENEAMGLRYVPTHLELADMFSTVEQFSNLSRHNVEGMEGLLANFSAVLEDFKKKPYDLLDYQKSHFDRDYLEFNANIQEPQP